MTPQEIAAVKNFIDEGLQRNANENRILTRAYNHVNSPAKVVRKPDGSA